MSKQSCFEHDLILRKIFPQSRTCEPGTVTLHRNHLRRYHVCPNARFPRGGPRGNPPLRQEGLRCVRAQGHLLRSRRRPSRAGANSRNRRFPPIVAIRRAWIRIDGDAGASVRAPAAPIVRMASSVIPLSNDARAEVSRDEVSSHAAATHRRFTLGTLETTDEAGRRRSTRDARSLPLLSRSTAETDRRVPALPPDVSRRLLPRRPSPSPRRRRRRQS